MIDPILKADLERDFVSRSPKRPQKLAEFVAAELPPAADWPWCVVAVTDKNCVGISTGATWLRADGTAL